MQYGEAVMCPAYQAAVPVRFQLTCLKQSLKTNGGTRRKGKALLRMALKHLKKKHLKISTPAMPATKLLKLGCAFDVV